MSNFEIIPISPAVLQIIEQQSLSDTPPLSREILLLDLKLATSYSPELECLVPQLLPGTVLQLLRTPSGDELEIGVFHSGTRIGSIPMGQNVVIARLMDAGKLLSCRVHAASVEHDFLSSRPWIRILVKIYLID